jgi:hypothetical protein
MRPPCLTSGSLCPFPDVPGAVLTSRQAVSISGRVWYHSLLGQVDTQREIRDSTDVTRQLGWYLRFGLCKLGLELELELEWTRRLGCRCGLQLESLAT